MSDDTRTAQPAPPTVKRTHPIRGLLWGLMFGVGLTFVLIVTTVISLDVVTMIVVTIVGTAAGLLWSTLGPAKPPKGAPPTVEQHENVTEAEAPTAEFRDEQDDRGEAS